MVLDLEGPPCPGGCPGHGCLESLASGTALGRAGQRAAIEQPDIGARAASAAEGRDDHGRARHRAGARRRRAARARCSRESGRQLGLGLAALVNVFNPEVIVIGGGVDRGGRSAARAGARGASRRGRCRRRRDVVRDRAGRASAPRPGCSARRRWPSRSSRERDASSQARPPRRLPDADRQPRGRHAARALGAARGRPRRLRGHAHARGAARPLRRPRRAASATTSTTSARARRELVERMRAGATVALVSDAGMPLVSDPGFVLVQACVAAGLAVEVLPGPSAALTALVASGAARRRAGASPASCRASAASCAGVLAAPETLVAFESPQRVAASLAVLAELDPDAPGRRLPRADEAARGGRARHGRRAAARYAAERAARRGRARRRRRAEAGVADAARRRSTRVRRLVDAGAKPRAAASVVAELTGASRRTRSTGALDAVSAERGCDPLALRAVWPASVLLRHHADLLRQRGAAPRPRVHDDRGRRARAPPSPARRGRVLPHRHRRARRAGRAGRRARGLTPQELADRNAARFQALTPQLDATNDFFIRTTRPAPREASQEVLQRVNDNGHVYEGKYEGWYCPRCADFKTENEIAEGNTCPIHKIPLDPRAGGQLVLPPVRLPGAARAAVRRAPRTSCGRARATTRRCAFIEQRPARRLALAREARPGACRVPWDRVHVFYVWFDALLNYYTALVVRARRRGPDRDASGRRATT